jgi:hypothetical protein
LLSNSPVTVAFVIVGIAGAILFIIGSLINRERAARLAEANPALETALEPAVDVATRIDLVERLAMVGQPWCVQQLNTIRDTDPDESVREAADAALTVIGSRPSY